VAAEVFTPPYWSQGGKSLTRFVDPSLNIPVCSSSLAHNAAQVGEAINFLDGLAIKSEGGFLACIYSHVPGLYDIDL